jgi:NTE family protein
VSRVPRVALVFAGGGARGAYEVGAMSVLLPLLERRGERPSIFVGTSVGAINSAALASTRHLPAEESVARELERWSQVHSAAVIRPVIPRLPITALRFAGGLIGIPKVRLESLLDPTPLKRNLQHWIDWRQLHRNIASQGPVEALSVVATAARTGRPVAFVEGALPATATRSHVIDYVAAKVEEPHVLASAAIPNTNSTHYAYLASRKMIAEESNEFEPSKMWHAIAESKGQEEEQQGKKIEEGT